MRGKFDHDIADDLALGDLELIVVWRQYVTSHQLLHLTLFKWRWSDVQVCLFLWDALVGLFLFLEGSNSIVVAHPVASEALH